jgi:hypothetical protein
MSHMISGSISQLNKTTNHPSSILNYMGCGRLVGQWMALQRVCTKAVPISNGCMTRGIHLTDFVVVLLLAHLSLYFDFYIDVMSETLYNHKFKMGESFPH